MKYHLYLYKSFFLTLRTTFFLLIKVFISLISSIIATTVKIIAKINKITAPIPTKYRVTLLFMPKYTTLAYVNRAYAI